ncbi:hypothetical protein AB0442_32630 [Kitasatospora sp. NPDC085895]|uniref:hypothetical protein n=1 Tax=Kitasatospora sp. NPDC085895 TaxID=3155057 RepID=UPI00345104A2
MNDLRVGASLAVGGLVLAALVVGGGYWALDGGLYGCTFADRRLQDPMADEVAALGTPGGARPDGEQYTDCDDDDRFAVAGRGYAEPARRSDVVQHYRAAAARNGWQPAPPDPDEPAWRTDPGGERIGLCFTKQVGGTTAHLAVSWAFDGRPGYTVEARASRTGSAWCA